MRQDAALEEGVELVLDEPRQLGTVKRSQKRHGGMLHRGQDVLRSVLIRTSFGGL